MAKGSNLKFGFFYFKKCDMESERKITIEQGKDFAAQCGIKFFENISKDFTNVSDTFMGMSKEIIIFTSNKKTNNTQELDNVLVLGNKSDKF